MALARGDFPIEIRRAVATQLGCEDLDVIVRPEWGARTGLEHRLAIRRGLADHLAIVNHFSLSHAGPDWIHDLEILPIADGFSISISHGPDVGGYAMCRSEGSIDLGFDLEKRARLSLAIVARVTTAEERATAPDPSFLWSAKEAVFKSLRGPHQPPVITDVEIVTWTDVYFNDTHRVYAFQARLATAALPLGSTGALVAPLDQSNGEIFAFFARKLPARLT